MVESWTTIRQESHNKQMSSSYNQAGGIVNASQSIATIGPSIVTNDTFCEESCLTDEQ